MNDQQLPDRIFISYVHEDHAIAAAIGDLLKSQGLQNIFFTGDEWLLYAGEIWLERIRTELDAADVVLCLFSKSSINHPWVHFEAGAAWLAKKVLIPICIRGLTIEDLRIPYAGIQSVNLKDRFSAYYLIRSVSRSIGSLVPPPFSHESTAWAKLQSALETDPGGTEEMA
jgi:hypothetical protein